MNNEETSADILSLTSEIVSAHVANNSVTSETLPTLINLVFGALKNAEIPPPNLERPEPAISIKHSVFPGYLVCLEDGKKLKMLKRRLRTSYNLTPDQYRKRWGLPHDYPMVAPNYAAHRSKLAKANGLGRKSQASKVAAPPTAPTSKKARK